MLTTSATAVATQAPQPKTKTRYLTGSGSYRSSHRKHATSNGTGMTAAATPITRAVHPPLNPKNASSATPQAAIPPMTPMSVQRRRRSERLAGGAAASARAAVG